MNGKPTLGLLGIMQELYDDMYPDITERQEKYARDICSAVDRVADIRFPGAARNRDDVERHVGGFNEDGLDGIIIVNLTYGPGQRLVRAFRENQLPVMIANTQPLSKVTADWDMSHLTFNQGIHGAQDTANALMRLGLRPPIVTADWRSDYFKEFVADFGHAAKAVQALKSLKVATVGQMPGMGDILTDNAAMMRQLGPQIDFRDMGDIHVFMQKITDAEINAQIDIDKTNFEIDPDLPAESHRYAARLQLAIEKYLEAGGYGAFSIYFDSIGNDGRFKQIHMLAASNLMAKGYGYAAEGDTTCAALVAAGHRIAPDAHFTEMYAMDFTRDTVLQSHMGEGNWKVARRDRPVRLVDRPLGIGGLANPPTVLFQAQPGPATLVSLVSVNGGKFRLVACTGEILDTEEMPNVEMPYFHFRPAEGVNTNQERWLKNGGTHHQCLHLGDVSRRWKMFCQLCGVEYAET
jgi:L-arabinose isomerase